MDESIKYYKDRYEALERVIRSIDYQKYYDDKKANIKNSNKGNALERKLEEISNNKSLKKLENQRHEMFLITDHFGTLEKNYEAIELIELFKDFIQRDGFEFNEASYMKETSIYNKNNYNELGKKEVSALRKENQELSQELYNLIEKYKRYDICNNDKSHIVPGINNRKEMFSMEILNDLNSNYFELGDINDITTIMSNAIRNEIQSPYSREYNKQMVNDAVAAINNTKNPSLSLGIDSSFQDYVNNIDFAKELGIDDRKLRKLKDEMIEFLEIARETWYLEEITEAFKNCSSVVNSECYAEVKEMISKQKNILGDKRGDLRRTYDETQIGIKVGVIRKLDGLARELEFYQGQYLARLQDLDTYSDEQRQESKDKINEIKRQMESIIESNDYINRERYAKLLDKKEPKMFNSKNSSVISEVNTNSEKYTSMNKEENNYYGEPTPIRQEQYQNNNSYSSNENGYYNQTNNTNSNNPHEDNRRIDKYTRELLNESSGERTRCYTNYNRMKLENKIDDDMSFSEFIEKYHPSYQKLIMVEKKREELAEEFYEEYINSGSTDNFENYMKKTEGVSKFDVPVGAELKKGKSR